MPNWQYLQENKSRYEKKSSRLLADNDGGTRQVHRLSLKLFSAYV